MGVQVFERRHPIIKHHTARLKAQGVVYAEVMLATGQARAAADEIHHPIFHVRRIKQEARKASTAHS